MAIDMRPKLYKFQAVAHQKLTGSEKSLDATKTSYVTGKVRGFERNGIEWFEILQIQFLALKDSCPELK